MVGLYQKRDPKYNQKAKLFKRVNNSSVLMPEASPNSVFMCMDLGFDTIFVSNDGRVEKVTTGKLETKDLKEGDIMPDDFVEYAGQIYIVTSPVHFEDDEKEKRKSKRPSGVTTFGVRR